MSARKLIKEDLDRTKKMPEIEEQCFFQTYYLSDNVLIAPADWHHSEQTADQMTHSIRKWLISRDASSNFRSASRLASFKRKGRLTKLSRDIDKKSKK